MSDQQISIEPAKEGKKERGGRHPKAGKADELVTGAAVTTSDSQGVAPATSDDAVALPKSESAKVQSNSENTDEKEMDVIDPSEDQSVQVKLKPIPGNRADESTNATASSVEERLRKEQEQEADDARIAAEEACTKVRSLNSVLNVLSPRIARKYVALREKTKMIAKGYNHAAMFMGDVGIGKSTFVAGILADMGYKPGEHFVTIRGHSTPMALYARLYANRDPKKIVIIDDCDAVFRSATSLDILKAVLDDKFQRKVYYETQRKKSGLPSSFVFSGKVIFITNYQPKVDDVHFLAIADRCLVLKMYFAPKEKLEYIKKAMVPFDYRGTTPDERQKVFEVLNDHIIQTGAHFSFRTYVKLLDYYKHDPNTFEVHLGELLDEDSDLTLLISIINENPGNKAEWQKKFCEITGKTRRTYFYVKKQAAQVLPPEKLK